MERTLHLATLGSAFLTGWTWEQVAWSAAVGALLLIGTAAAGVLLVIYLPPQYFSRPRGQRSGQRPWWSWAWLVARNLLGVVLIVLGIAMLVLPGQGVLTIVIGLMLLSIPGKRQLIAGLVKRTGMLEPVNRWRARFGREPLAMPSHS